MGLHQLKPPPSGRMGILWALAPIRDAALIEFGCMGHMIYVPGQLFSAGVHNTCNFYSTHIDETDIALGGMDRLRTAVADVIGKQRPRVVFLLPSVIPEVISTDLFAEAEMFAAQYPDTRFLTFGSGGFGATQHKGVQEALLQLVKTLPKDAEKTLVPTFNIIGSCADLLRFRADAAEMIRIMEGAFGTKPLCVLTSDTTIEDIENMGGAHINLVIRREGVPAAKHLKKRFGTPYLTGRPYGAEGTLRWIEEIAQCLTILPDRKFVDSEIKELKDMLERVMPMIRYRIKQRSKKARLSVGAHADVVRGVLDYGCGELSLPKGAFWCDSPDMHSEDIPYFNEEQRMNAIQDHEKGLLMTSGEALEWAGQNDALQIASPITGWAINPYEAPFLGFRGAFHLAGLWINSIFKADTN